MGNGAEKVATKLVETILDLAGLFVPDAEDVTQVSADL